MSRAGAPHRPLTTGELARRFGVPERTMRRTVIRLHLEDQKRKKPPVVWLFRLGREWRVNLSRMRAAHPEFFDAPTSEELQDQVDELRENGTPFERETRRCVEVLHAALRKHFAEHKGALGPDAKVVAKAGDAWVDMQTRDQRRLRLVDEK